jgi:hypothetical protein
MHYRLRYFMCATNGKEEDLSQPSQRLQSPYSFKLLWYATGGRTNQKLEAQVTIG